MYTYRDFNWNYSVYDVYYLDDVRSPKSYAIQSQYSASENILKLCEIFQDFIIPEKDIKLFFDKIFNVLTAEGKGLDIIGEWVGASRIFYDEDLKESIVLGDEDYRLLILYKALVNISSADAATLNNLLTSLVQTGIGNLGQVAYVLEVAPMVIRWVFESNMSPIQLSIFKQVGTLAKGAGVGWEILPVDPEKVFGFVGSGMQPFNQAPFISDNGLITGVS